MPRQCNREGQVCLAAAARTTGCACMGNCTSAPPLTKTKIKVHHRPNAKAAIIKLEENTEENLCNTGISKDLLDKTQSKNIKENYDKLGFKITNLCSLKKTKKMSLPTFPEGNMAGSGGARLWARCRDYG